MTAHVECHICGETDLPIVPLVCAGCGEPQAHACTACARGWARSPICGDCDYRARRAAVCAGNSAYEGAEGLSNG